jgi:hypothetical protein
MHNVSQVLIRHVYDAQQIIKMPTEAALLFHEHNFSRMEWRVYSTRGYSSTMPLFYFNFEEVPYEEKEPAHSDIFKFMRLIIDRM